MKRNERILDILGTVDPALVTDVLPDTAPKKKTLHLPRKRWLTAPMAAAMVILLTIGVAAAGTAVIMKIFNDPTITENNLQLTEVPEGYVGIYTVADLVQINRDLQLGFASDKYILMNDITFTDADYAPGGICEGGFIPIGYEQYRFALEATPAAEGEKEEQNTMPDGSVVLKKSQMQQIDMFNGNGHVIRNLQINLDLIPDEEISALYFLDEVTVGLFAGYSEHGPFQHTNIINLGLEGVNIRIKDLETAGVRSLSVGGIAGTCRYLGACYVKDISVEMEITLNEDDNGEYESNGDLYTGNLYYRVGGAVGKAQYVDACYVEDYRMAVTVNGRPASCFYGGGVAGEAQMVLTSWSRGEWDVSGEFLECEVDEFVSGSQMHAVPDAVTPEGYDYLCEKFAKHFGEENDFGAQQAKAHFVRKDLTMVSGKAREELKLAMDEWNKLYNLATDQPEGTYHEAFYIFDPTASETSRLQFHALLVDALGSEEEVAKFCAEYSLSVGAVHCTVMSEQARDAVETDYPSFDFANLWVLRDGIPRLQVFE